MLKVNIIGIGPGNPQLLTAAARQAIESSSILAGDKRMLANFALEGKQVHTTIKVADIVDIAAKADVQKDILGILVSGDVGFFSLAQTLAGRLPDCQVERYCGISSLVYFASRINMAWEDAKIISMHGRNQNLVNAVMENAKVFALTGGDNSPQKLCRDLCSHGLGDTTVYVGAELSYPEEQVICGKAVELAEKVFPSLSVMMVLNDKSAPVKNGVHGLADELFLRGKAPMTKQEIRSISLSKLRPEVDDIIYDIGAGTGSCSIELALQAPLGQVYAFEQKAEALELLQANKERFNTGNLEIVAGEASAEIQTRPAPDCVFIGGSSGNMCSILDTLYAKNSKCRIVINAITLETLAEVAAYYKAKEGFTLDIVNVFVAANRHLGRYNMMMAQNPIYVITALQEG